jgi:putative peptidoglycan lipid II flippase
MADDEPPARPSSPQEAAAEGASAAGGAPADEQAADVATNTAESEEKAPESSASTVATGIFSSKITGLVREGTFSHFFGVGAHADVLQTAFRIPNLLQNLLGEGTLSAAFIPIYSRMIEEGREREAGRFAGAIFGILLAVTSGFALVGMLLAPYFVALLAPGFAQDATGELPFLIGELSQFMSQQLGAQAETANVNRFRLAVQAVRVIFPMTAVLVLSAWALGVLNSHRRFFVPYVAPVLWNIAIIGTLFGAAFYVTEAPMTFDDAPPSTVTRLLFAACFGALGGGFLQFLVQLPLVAKVMKGFRFSLSSKVEGVREAIYAAGPVIAGRGVYQISAFVDMQLASIAAAGALASLRYAQTLYLLPISLFGLSVAASELPELSRLKLQDAGPFLRRVNRSMRQMMLMIVPTMIGYLALGFLVVGAFYQRGQFSLNDTWLVYFVLGGYTVGIAATAVSRLLQNSFYALSDTKTPALIAVLRIVVSVAVAVPVMFWLDQYTVQQVVPGFTRTSSQPLYLGAVGLAVGASVGAWMEVATLLYFLRKALGRLGLPWLRTFQMIGLALVALVPAGGAWWLLQGAAWPIYLRGALVVGVFGFSYLGLAWLLGFDELQAWAGDYL